MPDTLHLTLLGGRFAVCQAPHGLALPETLADVEFVSVTRTADEVSVVLPESLAPLLYAEQRHMGEEDKAVQKTRIEAGFACLMVQGPLDFAQVGILARLTGALAEARVPVFVLSTFNTDYLLVRDLHLATALAALRGAGCSVDGTPPV